MNEQIEQLRAERAERYASGRLNLQDHRDELYDVRQLMGRVGRRMGALREACAPRSGGGGCGGGVVVVWGGAPRA